MRPEKFHPHWKGEKFTLDSKSRHPRITHTKLPMPREKSCFLVMNILGPSWDFHCTSNIYKLLQERPSAKATIQRCPCKSSLKQSLLSVLAALARDGWGSFFFTGRGVAWQEGQKSKGRGGAVQGRGLNLRGGEHTAYLS